MRPQPWAGARDPPPPTPAREVPQGLRGTVTPATHPGAHVLQVGGVHSGAQCHGPSLCLLQVVLHLHDAELQVHTPALLDPALLVNFLQLLLQAGQDSLVCREFAGPQGTEPPWMQPNALDPPLGVGSYVSILQRLGGALPS